MDKLEIALRDPMYQAIWKVKEDLEHQVDQLKKDNENLLKMYQFKKDNDAIQMTPLLTIENESVANTKMAKTDKSKTMCKNCIRCKQKINSYAQPQP